MIRKDRAHDRHALRSTFDIEDGALLLAFGGQALAPPEIS